MPIYNRGGKHLMTLELGRVRCFRQDMILPGEVLNCAVSGHVQLAALREQGTLPIHVHLEAFLTPIRWLWPDWPEYIRQGPSGEIYSLQKSPSGTTPCIGVGHTSGVTGEWEIWFDNYLRVVNEYFKYPEEADITKQTVTRAIDNRNYGVLAVNLPTRWTRFIDMDSIADDFAQVVTSSAAGGREKVDLRDLAEQSKKFRWEMEQEWTSSDRYMEMIKATWNAAGVNEVDQVPFSIGQISGSMSAHNLWATDEDGLGAQAAIHTFDIDHNFGSIVAPEHCIVSYFLVMRIPPLLERERAPLTDVRDLTWAEIVGEPGILASSRPKEVRIRDFTADGAQTVLGYQPAGNHWRTGWDSVDHNVTVRNSFLIHKNVSNTHQAEHHGDMSRAFRSQSLGQALSLVYVHQDSQSPIPLPMSGVMTGAGL